MRFFKDIILFVLCIFVILSARADDYGDNNDGRDKIPIYHVYDDINLISALKFKYGTHNLVMKSVYPQLESGDDTVGIDAFNQQVLTILDDVMTQFKNNVIQNQQLQKKIKKSAKNSLYIDYSTSAIKSGTHHIISILFSIQGYIAGMAHPYHYHRVLNYDLDESEEIQLEDLFNPDTNYLDMLSNYTHDALSQKFTNSQTLVNGTAPKHANFKNWNIKSNGLLITFEEYQVAPSVHGTQSVLIPYSALKSIISSDSLIWNCVKNSRKCARNNLLTGGFIDQATNTRHRSFNPVFSKM